MTETLTFGDWLRQRRKALDLTQQQLADRAGCSDETIRKIEAGTRRPSREMVDALSRRLAVPPEERATLVGFARVGIGTPLPGVPLSHGEQLTSAGVSSKSNLPQPLTSFVGRHKETGEVRSLLGRDDVRLLTLTGAGGSGKTRLAVRVASGLLHAFPDGVFFASLAPITDSTLVASTIARTLGIHETPGTALIDSIKCYLSDKRLLLLLDNFEQVLGAAPLVAELLSASANLKVLATSRGPLHLYGERCLAVPPLQLPDITHKQPPGTLGAYEAVELFVQRASLVKHDFRLNDDNAAAVSEICERLDGLPLAIELAAARTNMLTPQAMLARMENTLSFLTGGPRDQEARQQSLRSTIDWSYNLLSPEEQTLFARLAVFAGGCTYAAARAVCASRDAEPFTETDLLETLASLIDKSLVWQKEDAGGEVRFWMLETIREFAEEKLNESGESKALRSRHALYFLKLAEHIRPLLEGPQEVLWLDRLEKEQDNLRAVFDWCRREEDSTQAERAEIALRLVGAVGRYWYRRGPYSEVRHLVKGVLALPGAEKHTASRGGALRLAGALAGVQGDNTSSVMFAKEALAIAREVGDRDLQWRLLTNLGISILSVDGDTANARSLHEQALAVRRELGYKHDRWDSVILVHLGDLDRIEGNFASARARYEEALAIARKTGDGSNITYVREFLGQLALDEGKYDSAYSLLDSSLAAFRESGDKYSLSGVLIDAGYAALGLEQYDRAEVLFRESLVLGLEQDIRQPTSWLMVGLAGVAAARGEVERAAKLLGAAEATRGAEDIKFSLPRVTTAMERTVRVARSQPDEETWQCAWQKGYNMSTEEAVEYALERH